MNKKGLFIIILIIFTFNNCSSVGKTLKSFDPRTPLNNIDKLPLDLALQIDLLKSQIKDLNKSMDALKPTDPSYAASKEEILKKNSEINEQIVRLYSIDSLQKKYNEILEDLDVKQNRLSDSTYMYSLTNISFVVAGIGLAVLTAFAVQFWPPVVATACGIVSGGLVTFQASIKDEGYTKESALKSIEKMKTDRDNICKDFYLNLSKAYVATIIKNDPDFKTAFNNASENLGQLEQLRLTDYLPETLLKTENETGKTESVKAGNEKQKNK